MNNITIIFPSCIKRLKKENKKPEEEKHARWIVVAEGTGPNHRDILRCSKCGFTRVVDVIYTPNYCESCGAKMDNNRMKR